MLTFKKRSLMPASAAALFAWHARPGAFMRLNPPWQPVRLAQFEGIHSGDRAIIKMPVGPFEITWVAEHEDYIEGRQFQDVQRKGPFKYWVHTHRMEPHPQQAGASFLVDDITFALPFSWASHRLAGGRATAQLDALFAYRHRITRQDLLLHARYPDRPLRVAVTGASGLIGQNLTALLTTGGHTVLRMVRQKSAVGPGAAYWNPETGEVDTAALEGVDAVVHLAGEQVFALRWSAAKKRRIRESRVRGTQVLAEALAGMAQPPKVLVSASGIGYYGDGGDAVRTEVAPQGAGFLAEVTGAWEAATHPASAAGIRVVHARIGVVLTPLGGALRQMLPAFKLGLGGQAGRGERYFPWIMLDDTLAALYHILHTPTLDGPVNLVAPEPVPFRVYAQTLGRVLRRPVGLKVPEGFIRAVMGEAGEEFAMRSIRAVPQKLLASGFVFQYPDLEDGLRHQLGKR